MPNLKNLAASSATSGFQNYDVQAFSMTVPGQFLPKFTGSLSSYSQTVTIPKNRLGLALTPQILSSVLANLDNLLPAGQYFKLAGAVNGNITLGSSGGFPIFYRYQCSVSADANNLRITLTVSNPSAVNDVTPPAITISGKAFLYLAPF